MCIPGPRAQLSGSSSRKPSLITHMPPLGSPSLLGSPAMPCPLGPSLSRDGSVTPTDAES